MNDIINQAYVINLDKRPDRWEDIQLNFSETGIKLNRWTGVLGTDLSDKQISEITTPFCNAMCSYSMIGCALSHIGIWRHIVKNNLTNVLVLEDDAYPVDNFNALLKEYWKQVPKGWDMLYLGCLGTCEKNEIVNTLYAIRTGKKNKKIYKDGKLMKNVYKPAGPFATHAYMISNKGAKKLLNHDAFKKISYHIDSVIANNIVGDDFNIYAVDPMLVYQKCTADYSDVQTSSHPIIDTVASKLKTNKMSIDPLARASSTVVASNRALDVNITHLTLSLFLMSFLVGYFGSDNVKNWYLYIIVLLYFLELLWYNKIGAKKIKELIIEALVILSGIFLGEKARTMVNK